MTDGQSSKKSIKKSTKDAVQKKLGRGKKRKSTETKECASGNSIPAKDERLRSPLQKILNTTTGSPAKKRNKLSLKGKDSILSKSVGSPSKKTAVDQSTQAADKSTPQKEHKPPCVAALYNLGNTCYLNSVLQVLRYTPGFVEDVKSLTSEVAVSRKEKAWQEQGEEEILTWSLVTHLKQTFDKMVQREKDYKDGKTPYIGVRPYDLLDTIENLNPMFSGGEQHDAHELLGCLMAYLQDAAVEINKHRKQNKERREGTATSPQRDKGGDHEDKEEEIASEVTHLGDDEDVPEAKKKKVPTATLR